MTKIIHRAWFGSIPMPERYRVYGERLQEMNPDWEYRLWTEESILALGLRNQAVWDEVSTVGGQSSTLPGRSYEASRATQLADVMGYEVIFKLGGVYLNCDMEPLRPMSAIPVAPDQAWGGMEGEGWVNNAAIGGPPGHPFWGQLVDELGRQWPARKHLPMEQATGPRLLTEISRQRSDLVTLPAYYFHFANYTQVEMGGDAAAYREAAYAAGSIVLHHWGHHAPEMQS